MKNSYLFYRDHGENKTTHSLCNYYNSPLDYHVSPIILNGIETKDRVIGINCFDEFLSFNDFQAFGSEKFPEYEAWKEISNE